MSADTRGAASAHVLVRWLFLRALAGIYLIAFVSLGVQIEGLYGSRGILPVSEYLAAVQRSQGAQAVWALPTLFWLDASDAVLRGSCAAGAVASLALLAGVAPLLSAAVAWGLYLSLLNVGRVFLSFQWDILLLETGFLALLFAPANLLPGIRRETAPSPVALWLARLLLFRLMFASGVVKLLSGDAAWWSLTALDFHYFTQPLPAWTSWYAHHLPSALQQASVALMFAVELAVPFLVFAPRPLRLAAFAPLVALQIAILATGNYTFFNLLTIALCLSLLDDRAVLRFVPTAWGERLAERLASAAPAGPRRLWPAVARRALSLLVAAVLTVNGTAQMLARFGYADAIPWQVRTLVEGLAPYHLTSSYGLFSFMTKTRPEILVEGSDDGATWRAYEFRWKPGDPARRPRFVQPHQPRLDWQMWFAALGSHARNPWFMAFQRRLLEGSPPVLALLASNPFPAAPPRYVRAMLYDYRFSDPGVRRETGHWWTRTLRGQYSPTLQRPG